MFGSESFGTRKNLLSVIEGHSFQIGFHWNFRKACQICIGYIVGFIIKSMVIRYIIGEIPKALKVWNNIMNNHLWQSIELMIQTSDANEN